MGDGVLIEPTALSVVTSSVDRVVDSPSTVVVSLLNCDKDSILLLLLESGITLDISVAGAIVVESCAGTVVVVDMDACNRDRISCAKSISLFRIVVVGIAVVVSTSIMLLDSASVVGVSVVELTSTV